MDRGTVSARAGALRAIVDAKAHEARGLNPLPKEASGGREGKRPSRTARAISARAWRAVEAVAARASSRCFREPAAGSVAKAPPRKKRPTSATRSTAPTARQVASWTASPAVGRGEVWGSARTRIIQGRV